MIKYKEYKTVKVYIFVEDIYLLMMVYCCHNNYPFYTFLYVVFSLNAECSLNEKTLFWVVGKKCIT